jgi:hypothetical protein
MKLFFIISIFFLTFSLNGEDEQSENTYEVSVSLTDHGKVISMPTLTVNQDRPSTLKVNSGDSEYSVKILVHWEEGNLLCTACALVTSGKVAYTSPRISVHVGKLGFVHTEDLKFSVKATLKKV